MIRRVVRCRADRAEQNQADLGALVPAGFEQADGPEWVEYSLYGAEEELPDEDAIRLALGNDVISVTAEPIPDDWETRWQEFHREVVIDDRIRIRAPWHRMSEVAAYNIMIEPGRGFGTGSHASTRLAARLMMVISDAGWAYGDFADLGCGSGVLSCLAYRFGYYPVHASDNDPAAVEATRKNAVLNSAPIDVYEADLTSDEIQLAQTVVANLTLPLLREIEPKIAAAEEVQRFICSGLLASEELEFGDKLRAAGFKAVDRRDEAPWAAVLYARDTAPGNQI